MKSVRKVLLGVLVLGVLCFSLLATAPWNARIAPMTPYTIPLGVAHLYEDTNDDNMLYLGVAHLYDTP